MTVPGSDGARKLNGLHGLAVRPPFAEEWEVGRRPTIGKLDTPGRIRREMVRLYRDARLGALDVGSASKLANILFLALRAMEVDRTPRDLPPLMFGLYVPPGTDLDAPDGDDGPAAP